MTLTSVNQMLYLKNDYDNDDKCHVELGMRFLIIGVWTKSL